MNQNGTPKVRASANLLKRFFGRVKAWPGELRERWESGDSGHSVDAWEIVEIVLGLAMLVGVYGIIMMFVVSSPDDLAIAQIMAAPLLIVIALVVLFYAALIVFALVVSIPFWAWVIIVLLLVLINK